MMQSLRESSISQIRPIPGLFISDRFAARSLSLLNSLDIGYILSITCSDDLSEFSSEDPNESEGPSFTDRLVMKHIDIDDDATEDILYHLKEACDWIEAGLGSRNVDGEDGNKKTGLGGVLVHCTQGISRSGSIIIAYLMRKLSLDYSAALALARESRPLITPNPGFEYQLRVWHFCEYDIYHSNESSSSMEKKAYIAWKSNRDAIMGRGEEAINKARFASMASMAASFGKRRIRESDETGSNNKIKGSSNAQNEERQKAWENVEKMEKEWTRRLVTGSYPPWEAKNESDN